MSIPALSERDGLRADMGRAPSQLYVDGDWRPSTNGALSTTVDPATGITLREIAEADDADVDAAVSAARQSLEHDEWARMAPSSRARILWRIAELIEEDAQRLAILETLDQGQPFGVARDVSVTGTAEHFRYFAGWVTKIDGATHRVSQPDVLHYTRREPVGVCALILPWNFPLMILAWKLAPALACGNTVIIKPAEQTPLTAIRLVELCEKAGIPRGVVNLLTGGPAVGRALVRHPGVDKISFTGSTDVGRQIARDSASNLARLTLELGGKAPSIVTEHADLDAAVRGCVMGAMFNTGQVCAAYSRFYVHSKHIAEFSEKAASMAASLRLAPGFDDTCDLGPLVSEEHLARVDDLVRSGVAEGATLLTGGARANGALRTGSFYQPTVFADVSDDMAIAREEIFGPVMSILSYEDVDDLVTRANASEFGLAASVWTTNLAQAHSLAAAVRAGSVFVNLLHVPDPAAPWGGFKASGFGREMGPYALEAYTEVKGIFVNTATDQAQEV